jgi:glycosyltransferase involved in cell wall biosynthesis
MGAFFQDREIDVLHITKANSGGAALAAKRISDAMCMSNGVRSTIQYLDGPESKTVWCRACESIDRRVNELGNEEFQISLIKSYRSNVILRNQKADILNIHWLPGVLSHSLINQMKNYPKVFWTLHDMNPFTGVCHQSGDCLKFEKNCKSCPAMVSSLKPLSQKVWQYRRNLYSSFDSLNFIAPSRWMAEVAGKSPLMAGKKIYQVYNPQKFEDTPNKKFTEDFLNIAILGSNYHSSKGSPESVIILNRLIREFHNEVAVTVIGDLPPELVKPARIYQLPPGGTQESVSEILGAVDLIIYCSKADTLPNLLIEAQGRGVAVVAMNYGGVGETFSAGNSGFLVNGSLEEVFQACKTLFLNKSLLRSYQKFAFSYARKTFGMEKISNMYREILNENR